MFVLSIALAVFACSLVGGEKGSGTPKTETREVGAFTAVKLVGSVRAEITAGTAQHVELSGDDNIVPLIRTEVTDKRLVIEPKKSVQPKLELVARIAMPTLSAVSTSGSASVSVAGIANDSFDLHTSGSAKIVARGAAKKLAINVSGAATLDAKELDAQDVTIDVSGSGELDVHASGVLDVHISGSATVRYYGSPTAVKKSISGAGTIEQR
jgi:hypothetical protein